MENREIVQTVLQEFGKIIDLETLGLNDEGSCRLMFDQDIEVNIEVDDSTNSLLLISPVVPADKKLYEDVLELNLFWSQMKGCRFALLRSAGVLAMMRRLSVEGLNIITFEKVLEEFVDTVSTWKAAFARAPQHNAQKKTPAPSEGWNAHHLSGRA
ncbi:MAG: type III secretion system chaperone [Desulfovibrionales bacterium]|nr:type III secretion system chaperone [Desulfovibrionales bacterium]